MAKKSQLWAFWRGGGSKIFLNHCENHFHEQLVLVRSLNLCLVCPIPAETVWVDSHWVVGLAHGPSLPHRGKLEPCLVVGRQRRLQEGIRLFRGNTHLGLVCGTGLQFSKSLAPSIAHDKVKCSEVKRIEWVYRRLKRVHYKPPERVISKFSSTMVKNVQ